MNFNELEHILQSGTKKELLNFTSNNNLIIKDGKIYHQDDGFIREQIAFWDKRQLVKKINLNS